MPQAPPEPVYVLRGHRAAVQCVSFLPNCKGLAAGDAEGELKLWDLDSRRPAASIRAHVSTSGILQVACPASHPWVVSQGRDGVVKCWELHSGSSFNSEPVQQLTSGCYNFCRFALLEAGQTSSSCCRALVAEHSTQPGSTPAHPVVGGFSTAAVEGAAAAVAAAVDGEREASGSSATRGSTSPQMPQQAPRQQHAQAAGLLSQELKQQQQQQQQPFMLQQQPQQVACNKLADLAVGQQGQHAAVATTAAAAAAGAGAVQAAPEEDDLTEAAEEQLMSRNTDADSNSPSSSALRPSPSPTAAAAAGPCFIALPAEDPAALGIWQIGGPGLGQGTAAAAGGGGDTARPSMLLQQRVQPDRVNRGQCMAVVLLQPQGQALHALTGHEDGAVVLWDTRNCSTYLAAQKLHNEPVMCLAAAADCCSGFSGSADDRLASFDVDIPQGRLRAGPQNTLPQQGLADVAIRPDGRIAATAGWDAKVRVWHCKKRQPLALLRWHSQQVACVGFSSDSMLLAAGGRGDNAISMWSLYPPKAAAGTDSG